MPTIDHIDQTRTQQIILFLSARTVLHGQNRNCKVSAQIMQNLGVKSEKNQISLQEINDMGLVQGELGKQKGLGGHQVAHFAF